MSKQYLLVTIIGPDRRGIVAKITEIVVSHHANIEESRMARLGGEFAALLLLSISNGNKDGLLQSLGKIDYEKVHLFIKETDLSRIRVFEGFIPYQISVVGADHMGIVHTVAEYLAEKHIQVEEMETRVSPAPLTGTPLFSMHAMIQVPPDIKLPELREKLFELGDKMGVEIEIRYPLN